MRNTIIRMWRGEARCVRWVLYIPFFILSMLYRLILYFRGIMYKKSLIKTEQPLIPVISVGNVSLGGTGKTPVVEALARRLKEKGFNPGIITRGYKRRKKGVFVVDVKTETARTVGDEAYMLARRTKVPVIVGTNRHEAIRCGITDALIDMAILDDGFQVKNLEKDVDLVVLNGKEIQASRDLFPLGPYREPLTRLREADAILVNKGEIGEEIFSFTEGIPTFMMAYEPLYIYNVKKNLIGHHSFLKGKRVVAFSGLGDNASFFDLLRKIDADVVHEVPFPDHHRYTAGDIRKCASLKNVDCLVTTEKDAVKITGLELPENLYYLSIEATIRDEDRLLELVLGKIGAQARHFLQGFGIEGTAPGGSNYLQ